MYRRRARCLITILVTVILAVHSPRDTTRSVLYLGTLTLRLPDLLQRALCAPYIFGGGCGTEIFGGAPETKLRKRERFIEPGEKVFSFFSISLRQFSIIQMRWKGKRDTHAVWRRGGMENPQNSAHRLGQIFQLDECTGKAQTKGWMGFLWVRTGREFSRSSLVHNWRHCLAASDKYPDTTLFVRRSSLEICESWTCIRKLLVML